MIHKKTQGVVHEEFQELISHQFLMCTSVFLYVINLNPCRTRHILNLFHAYFFPISLYFSSISNKNVAILFIFH